MELSLWGVIWSSINQAIWAMAALASECLHSWAQWRKFSANNIFFVCCSEPALCLRDGIFSKIWQLDKRILPYSGSSDVCLVNSWYFKTSFLFFRYYLAFSLKYYAIFNIPPLFSLIYYTQGFVNFKVTMKSDGCHYRIYIHRLFHDSYSSPMTFSHSYQFLFLMSSLSPCNWLLHDTHLIIIMFSLA